LENWKDTFFWYPDPEEGDSTSPRAELTRLDPSEYREIVYGWRISDFIVWLEENRVRDAFEEIT